MLTIQNLSYSYLRKDDAAAIADISFSLPDAKIGVLLGPNGAGKSTLLKCITGIYATPRGHIFFQDKDLSEVKENERAKFISYVPQAVQISSLTVYDAVLMGRIPYIGWRSTKADREIVSHVLEEMNLTALAMKNVSDLSGGERQKVIIARALAQEAKLLLFDEPTSSLDITSQWRLLTLIKKTVREKNLSCLISMHDINLALSIGDIFCFIKDGKLRYQGGKDIVTSKMIHEIYGLETEVKDTDEQRFMIYKEEI